MELIKVTEKHELILEHHRFLLDFGRQMGPLAEVEQVFWIATTLLGEYLGIDRCYFAEFDPEHQFIIVHRNYCNKLESLERIYALSAISPDVLEQLQQDRAVSIEPGDPAGELFTTRSFSGQAAEEAAIPGGLTTLVVPLIKDGNPTMMVVLQSLRPGCGWQEPEIALSRSVLEITFLAVRNASLYQQARRVAVIEERTRIARELHDSLAQALYSIQLGLNTALVLQKRNTPSEAITAKLNEVLLMSEGTKNELRSLIFDLRPEALHSEGLVHALNNFISTLRTRYDLKVNSQLGPEPNVPLALKEALYWIARQSLQNVVSHARAELVDIRLETREHQIYLRISDNGRGFEVAQNYPGHWGLRFMRTRAAELGGECEISSQPGQGATIEVFVPLPKEPGRMKLDQQALLSRDSFALKFDKLNQRVQNVQKHSNLGSQVPGSLLEQAFLELNNALEELQVTEESMSQRYNELELMYQELDNQRQYYQELFEQAPVGYILTDNMGLVHEANNKACQMLNSLKSFMIGKPLRSFIARQGQASFDICMSNMRMKPEEYREQEWPTWLQPRKAPSLPVELKAATRSDRKNNLVGFRWLLRPISPEGAEYPAGPARGGG